MYALHLVVLVSEYYHLMLTIYNKQPRCEAIKPVILKVCQESTGLSV